MQRRRFGSTFVKRKFKISCPIYSASRHKFEGRKTTRLGLYGHYAGNDFTVAIREVKKIAALPPACGSELRRFKPVNGRKWHGHVAANPNDLNDATLIMCEDCHLYSVKGTLLENFLGEYLTHLTYDNAEGHRCSTRSKQCKRRLRTACETNNFAAYAQYHHKREEVYKNLWRSMDELKPHDYQLAPAERQSRIRMRS
ncbi:hypothetical protein BKA65DRAFT_485630 [Rhexocercosporidium sp. MPI-PUGE-AT-0058]|nr:hypothetical protein BKA65DRAFT_485630 [Rhexocercosporidium sp. MPI-PUGE-AT-0058]